MEDRHSVYTECPAFCRGLDFFTPYTATRRDPCNGRIRLRDCIAGINRQHLLLLFRRKRRREHHDRDFQHSAPLQKQGEDLTHIDVIGVQLIDDQGFSRKPQQAQHPVFDQQHCHHSLIHCANCELTEQPPPCWLQPASSILCFLTVDPSRNRIRKPSHAVEKADGLFTLVTFQQRPHPCYHLVRSCRCGQGNIKSIFMPLFSHLEGCVYPRLRLSLPHGRLHQHGHNPFLALLGKDLLYAALQLSHPLPRDFRPYFCKPIPKILWDRFKPTVGKETSCAASHFGCAA